MYYWMKLAHVAITGLCKKPASKALDRHTIKMRAKLVDLDFNGHVNNSRFLSMMDVGRTHLFFHSEWKELFKKQRILPIATGVDITYLKSLSFGSTCDLTSEIIYWDDRWLYMKQSFVKENDLLAVGAVKLAVMKGRKRISPESAMAMITGDPAPTPSFPEEIREIFSLQYQWVKKCT